MTKTQSASTNRIKDIINGEQKDYFDWITEPGQQGKKQRLNKLVHILEEYRRVAFTDRYVNAGYENMNEAVYWMLGQSDYADNVVVYRYETQKLLRMLATPSVMEAVKNAGFNISGSFLEMVDSLLDFFIMLDGLPYQSILLSRCLQSNGTAYTDEEIETMILDYEERLRSALTGRTHF